MPGQCRPITSTSSPALNAGSTGPIPHTISGSGSLTEVATTGELNAAARRLLREWLPRAVSRESNIVVARFLAETPEDDVEDEDEDADDVVEVVDLSGKAGERVRPRLRPALALEVPPAVSAGTKEFFGFTNCVGSLTARDSARRWSDSFAWILASLLTGTYSKIEKVQLVGMLLFRMND